MKLKAVIFDLNGTVLSDEETYGYAFKRVLLGLGAQVKTDHPHKGGVGMIENWLELLKEYRIKTKKTVEELSTQTQKEYIAQIDEIELNSGFLKFAKDLKESEIRIALATSNTWNVVETILNKFDLIEFFDCVTTVEEVDRGKPDPRIFFLTAEKLMTDPQACLVFEDSKAGVKAARAAEMKVVGIARNRKQREELKEADRIISDFYEVTPKILDELG